MSHNCPVHGCQHQSASCSHGAQGQCCCNNHDSCEHHHDHENFAHQLLEIADEAWMEVLKEKIKEQIAATSGNHLDGLAKLVTESNNARWKNKLASQKNCDDFKEKISQFFNKQ